MRGGALGRSRSAGRRLGLLLADVFVPARCAVCGRGEVLLCPGCRVALELLDGPLCTRCGAPTAWPVARCAECAGRRLAFASARSAVAYEGPARRLVAGWKERGLRRLDTVAAELVTLVVPRPPVAALAFVPGDPERTARRGQNPPQALADALASVWDLPVEPLLERRGGIPPQRGLSRLDRRSNVREAFRATGGAPTRVALVDDVYTTGATVAAAAKELRRAGAGTVHVVTFARTVRR